MKFLHNDIGYRQAGTLVEVTLGSSANVRLLDNMNYQHYKAGRSFRQYYAGHYRRSPVTFEIPRADRWHVVVDLGGYAGRVSAGVRVLDN